MKSKNSTLPSIKFHHKWSLETYLKCMLKSTWKSFQSIFLSIKQNIQWEKLQGGSWFYPAGVNQIVKYDNGAPKGRSQKHKSFTTWPGLYIKINTVGWIMISCWLIPSVKSAKRTQKRRADFSPCHVLVTEQCEKVFWQENKHRGYFWLQHASTSLFPFLSLIPEKTTTQTCDAQHNLHIHISAHNRGKHRHTA